MLKEDFVVQSNVRRLLVRNNIDYSELIFGTVRGVVYLRGIFKMARYYSGDEGDSVEGFTAKTLVSLEKRIKGLPGVTDVVFQLTNWKKEKGQWIPKEKIE
jgi:hypothetical protein